MSFPPQDDSFSEASSYYAPVPPPTASETKEPKALESNPVKMKLTQDILLQKEQIDILKDIYKTIRNFKQQIDTTNSMIRPTLTAIKNCTCKKEKKPQPTSPPPPSMYIGGGRRRRKTKRHKRKSKNRRRKKRKTTKKRRKKRKTKRIN